MCLITYHNGEDDGQEGGLEDPEHSQTYDLDQREQVYPPQRYVTEVGEVGLVLGRHHVQLNSVPELWRTMSQAEEKSKRSEWHRLITCRPIMNHLSQTIGGDLYASELSWLVH